MRHNLITARKTQELTQAQLGAKAGLTKQGICQLERGRANGSESTWKKLAKILGSTIDHLSLDEAALESFRAQR